MKNILLVDDEQLILDSLKELLRLSGDDFNILTAGNGRQAARVLDSTPVDLVITDLNMPEMDGFGLLAYAAKNHPCVPVVVMSASMDREAYERLQSLGVRSVTKPFSFSKLLDIIRSCFAQGPRKNADSLAPGLAL